MTTASPATGACYTCTTQARRDLPARERIMTTGSWTLAHAFGANLEGWLVLFPTRHVTALDELTEAEAAQIGGLQRDATRALRAAFGCEKTYVLLLAEMEGFHHVHFHIVPRMPNLDVQHRGIRIFSLLHNDALPVVSDERMDEIALDLRAQLAASRPRGGRRGTTGRRS